MNFSSEKCAFNQIDFILNTPDTTPQKDYSPCDTPGAIFWNPHALQTKDPSRRPC